MKRHKQCCECGEELGEFYHTIKDNHIQRTFFSYEDGRDNAFCSTECLCAYISVETEVNEKE